MNCVSQEFKGKKYITVGPPLTRKPLTRFTLPRFLAYVHASGDFSVSRGPQYSFMYLVLVDVMD